jgi:hypothetical protein
LGPAQGTAASVCRFLPAGVQYSLESDWIAMGARAELVIEVPAVTVDSILLDHAVQPRFDLLSIDAEGHERKVFKGLSLRCWCPRRVLLEDHETGHQKRQHMLSQGCQWLPRTGLNCWYGPATLISAAVITPQPTLNSQCH